MRTITTSLLLLTATPALAQHQHQHQHQHSDVRDPGMPVRPAAGQTDRFSNEFNPAIGAVIDAVADHVDHDSGEETDGLDLRLRTLELSANSWIDPDAWAYAVIIADEEEIELEEAAVHYVGFESNTTLRAGRFFVDFGKQMQAHVHDLPYPNRPAVLREYLGDELAGTGLQVDHWWAADDSSTVRASFGVFDSLAGGHRHGGEHGEEEEEGAEIHLPGRSDFGDLNLTLRLTGFHDVGKSGVLQWGLSTREVPEFAFELESSDFEAEGLTNNVLGADLTYGLTDETGVATWTFGTEVLLYAGDIGAEVDDQGTPDDATDDTLSVLDGEAFGYYAWAEHGLDARNAIGVLFSNFEHPEEGAPDDSELTLYYTHHLSELSRLRFSLTQLDSHAGDDETALLVQFTNIIGPH